MSLENPTPPTIAGLSAANPAATDPFNQGDDHIRLIKNVLKTIFPGSGTGGFAIPITATEAELNFVHGVTSAIQAQITAVVNDVAPLLTPALFSVYQTADQTITTAVKTKLLFAGIIGNSGNFFNTTNSRFLPSVAGWYQFNAYALFKTGANINLHQLIIAKGGINESVFTLPFIDATLNAELAVSTLVHLNGSEYVEVYCLLAGTGTLKANGSFNGFLVRAD
jgi:hypothetical protein